MIWDISVISNPVTFWEQFGDSLLSHLGFAVTSYVPQACTSERNWSMHVQTHTKECNHLQLDSVRKISRVKHAYWRVDTSEVKRKLRGHIKKLTDPVGSLSMGSLFGTSDSVVRNKDDDEDDEMEDESEEATTDKVDHAVDNRKSIKGLVVEVEEDNNLMMDLVQGGDRTTY